MTMRSIATLAGLLLAQAILVTGTFARADEQGVPQQERTRQEARTQQQIYGYDLMTEQERSQYRQQMNSLQTEQERAEFRARHHEEMRKRAEQQGKSLPDKVPEHAGHKGMPGHAAGKGPPQGGGKGAGKDK
jgi:hypothetical protein